MTTSEPPLLALVHLLLVAFILPVCAITLFAVQAKAQGAEQQLNDLKSQLDGVSLADVRPRTRVGSGSVIDAELNKTVQFVPEGKISNRSPCLLRMNEKKISCGIVIDAYIDERVHHSLGEKS